MEGGAFGLERFLNLPEHLAGGGLIEMRLGVGDADGLQHFDHRRAGDLGGEDGLIPGGADEALGAEVIDFRGLGRTLCLAPLFSPHLTHQRCRF
jgi:hypothetical protein